MEIKNETIKKNSCVFVLIICCKELDGKKPPAEISVIDKLRPLKSLTSENIKKVNIKLVKKTYKKKTFKEIF